MAVAWKSPKTELEQEGYAVFSGVLDVETDIEPVWREYASLLDDLAVALLDRGEVSSTYSELPFTDRLIELHRDCGRDLSRHFDISLPEGEITEGSPFHVGPAVFHLLTSPRLLDLVESVIGHEILAHPLQRVRMKLPDRVVRDHPDFTALIAPTPWHQDTAVVMPEADETDLLTVWVPLNEATAENGALEIYPQSHRSEVLLHCPSPTIGPHIPDPFLPAVEPIPVPMSPGDLLLLHSRVVHRSLPNITDDEVRISWDLRYQPVDQPTGREQFPGFIVRSRANPDSVFTDPKAWADVWYRTRSELAKKDDLGDFFRWGPDPIC